MSTVVVLLLNINTNSEYYVSYTSTSKYVEQTSQRFRKHLPAVNYKFPGTYTAGKVVNFREFITTLFTIYEGT